MLSSRSFLARSHHVLFLFSKTRWYRPRILPSVLSRATHSAMKRVRRVTIFLCLLHQITYLRPDFVQFQEAVLNSRVLFTAGAAEIKSKGRGEESISQNVRIIQSPTAQLTLIVFTNAQRKEKKQYIFIPRKSHHIPEPWPQNTLSSRIPVAAVDHMEQPKKNSRPVSLRLRGTSDLMSQLKALHIQFLDDHGKYSTNPVTESY